MRWISWNKKSFQLVKSHFVVAIFIKKSQSLSYNSFGNANSRLSRRKSFSFQGGKVNENINFRKLILWKMFELSGKFWYMFKYFTEFRAQIITVCFMRMEWRFLIYMDQTRILLIYSCGKNSSLVPLGFEPRSHWLPVYILP